jgi:tetratricopeptide (TPR) repeat protein
MAAGWRWREDVLAEAAANSEFHEVDRELPVLWGLADAETLDAQQRAEFQSRAAGIAAHYPLGNGVNWRRQPGIARLPKDHQEQLLDQLRTIAFLQAELALRDAPHAAADQRAALLNEAHSAQRRLLQLELGPADSAAVAHQQARLAALQRADVTLPRLANSAEAQSTSTLDRRLLALQYMREHRHAQALPLLESLASHHPDDVALLLQLGNCYRALERWPAAEGCYTACAALRPDLAFPFYYRGLLQLEQQQYAPAVKSFAAALERDDAASAHVNLGLAYRGLGEHRQAAKHFARALDLGSPETRVWLLLAQSREQLHDVAGAAASRMKWRESQPADALSWIARGVEQLASDPTAAEASFRAALKLDPDSPAALQNLAHVLAERQQQSQAAIDVLTQSLRSAPDDALALGSRAVLLARIGSGQAARDDAAAAVKLAPRSGLAWYQSACVEAILAADDAAPRDRALDMLEAAVAREPPLGALFFSDSDLQSLHDHSRLREIVALAARLEATALRPRSALLDGEK